MEKNSELKGTDELEFAERLNERLANELSFLRGQFNALMIMHQQLLDKLLDKKVERAPIDNSDFQPIGGYTSLRKRIEEAEQESRIEAAKKETEDAS